MSSLPEDWTTTLSDIADDVAGGISDFTSSVGDIAKSVWSNISDGLSLAYSDGKVPDFIGGLVSGGSQDYSSNYAARQGFGYVAPPEEKKSWGDMFTNFVSDKGNQKMLVELGFGAIKGMASISAAKELAESQSKGRMDELKLRDSLEQEANKRFSDSVGGLAAVKKFQPKPLKRLDGSRVFTPTGLINQGVK